MRWVANFVLLSIVFFFRHWAVQEFFLARMASESIAHEAEAEWAIDSGAMRARAIIVLVKSNELVKNIETKQL